jgi:hypothetical protein
VQGPGQDDEQVRRQRRGGRERPATFRRGLVRQTVAQHRPPGGGEHRDRERCLQVGLVEAGEDPLRVVDPEIGPDVGLPVDRVDEAVHALTGAGVAEVRLDLQHVLRPEVAKRQTVRCPAVLAERAAVEPGADHPVGAQLHEGLGAGTRAAEPHHGP